MSLSARSCWSSSPVGRDGRVIAEDIRKLRLVFLWFRAVSRRDHNVNVVLGDPTDPHLPPRVNAVLISNTYHEFADSHSILVHVYQALVPAGRLVVVDREPYQGAARSEIAANHEISVDRVQKELQQENFQIIRRHDRFIEHDPDGENWWLIAARKP